MVLVVSLVFLVLVVLVVLVVSLVFLVFLVLVVLVVLVVLLVLLVLLVPRFFFISGSRGSKKPDGAGSHIPSPAVFPISQRLVVSNGLINS